jgi:hypothetical protein
LTQEQRVLGAKALAAPLTRLINSSLTSGVVPEAWKEAIITPILKKGDPTEKQNYRPVSCLSVASKVLEKIVNDQVSSFMEAHKLLPDNQELQKSQNKLLRALTGKKVSDGIKIEDILKSLQMMSVNQIAAQIKLKEMWKALNDSQYPLRVEQKSETEDGIGTRSLTRGDLIEFGSSTNSKKSFLGSSTRLWNVAPEEIKKSA